MTPGALLHCSAWAVCRSPHAYGASANRFYRSPPNRLPTGRDPFAGPRSPRSYCGESSWRDGAPPWLRRGKARSSSGISFPACRCPIMLPASSATGGRAVLAGVVLTSLPSNHAKAALLAVGGRLFQRFKGTDPWILDFGLPVESGLGYFFVVESEPLLRSQILDDHSQPSPIGPKSACARITSC
jgi:hypothetical protein